MHGKLFARFNSFTHSDKVKGFLTRFLNYARVGYSRVCDLKFQGKNYQFFEFSLLWNVRAAFYKFLGR